MSQLKLSYKVVLINISIAIVASIISEPALGVGHFEDYAFTFGIVCLTGGIVDLFAGLILMIAKSQEWGKGFLLSAAALLLLSGISCGGAFSLG